MIIKIGKSDDNEFNLHLDTNENLVFLEMNGVYSIDYTKEELTGLMKEMITNLEMLK